MPIMPKIADYAKKMHVSELTLVTALVTAVDAVMLMTTAVALWSYACFLLNFIGIDAHWK